MTNITIANNKIEGRDCKPVRIRLCDINLQTGEKQPTDIVFDIAPGKEERVNLVSGGSGFEVRPIIEGTSFAGDEKITPDLFGVCDAYNMLKAAVKAIPMIRNDATLTQAERDTKAAAAWSEALRLAGQ